MRRKQAANAGACGIASQMPPPEAPIYAAVQQNPIIWNQISLFENV